ncbi:uncharacterized protein [Procambarus clarkii]|uniref:uncharacterized protein n=1 Tax=Procambarus clarkii TaxID=6728 RepID=UPI003742E891
MEENGVAKGNHPSISDKSIHTISVDKDSSQVSPISNPPVYLPSQDAGIMSSESKTVQEEGQYVRQRHAGQQEKEQIAEVCNSNDARLDLLDDQSHTQSKEKSCIEEREEVEDTGCPSDVCLIKSSRKEEAERDEVKEITDVADKEGISVTDIVSNSSSAEYVTHTLSFPLTSKSNDRESVCDTESESQLSISLVSSSDLSGGKVKNKTKKHKTPKYGKDGRNSDSSVSSKKKGTSNKTRIKSKFAPGSLEYIEERLCGRIFSGWVEERRWVESLRSYRDVIEVDEWEIEMNQQLKAIISSIPGVYEGTKWINLTPPGENSSSYCLWILLPAPPIPGHYWYTVTGVQLEPLFGLRILVKEIRLIHPHDGETAIARQKRHQKVTLGNSNSLQTVGEQLLEYVKQVRQLNLSDICSSLSSTITLGNIKEIFRFFIVLVMTLVIGLFSFWKEAHNLGLRFIREAGIFFHHITPFLQSVLSFVEKLVGGMYLLIAMVYRDWRRPSAPPPPYPPGSQSPRLFIQGPSPASAVPPGGSRLVKYVPPEQWVFRNQNNESSPR